MTVNKIIGVGILVAVFGTIFALIWHDSGLFSAMAVFVVVEAVVILLLIMVAVYFLERE